jgi:uncharacterized protein (DUF58 family)
MTITRAGLVFGSALVLLGVVVAAPTFVLVGLLGLLALGVSRLWSRFGLRDLHYERSIGRDRTLWGDDVSLDIAVWNDKPLPLPWLSVDDFATGSTIVREESLVHTDLPGLAILRSRWTVGSYERVVRHLTIAADRRGMYALGPVRVTVADPFGYGLATEEHEDRGTLIVRPRTLPVRLVNQQHAPAGALRTRHSLFEDPALFAGVRPYRPGDPMRRVHWRATARTGTPVSKRFDPSRLESLLVALDVQTMSGTIWKSDDEMVESLMVAASSLVRHSLIEGASCGLAAMALSRTPEGSPWSHRGRGGVNSAPSPTCWGASTSPRRRHSTTFWFDCRRKCRPARPLWCSQPAIRPPTWRRCGDSIDPAIRSRSWDSGQTALWPPREPGRSASRRWSVL